LDQDFTWMPNWMFVALIQTGLPGALIVLAFGQLMPQLIATTNPITFMNLPGTWSVLQLCLCFETVGVTHFSWVLSATVRFVFTMGAKEDIKAPDMDDNALEMSLRNKPSQSQRAKRLRSSITVSNVDDLYNSASDGLLKTNASELQNDRQTMAWLQNHNLQSTSQTGIPSKAQIVRLLIKKGNAVPRYLLPAFHKSYIPAWLVAFELFRREADRDVQKLSGSGLEKKTFCA